MKLISQILVVALLGVTGAPSQTPAAVLAKAKADFEKVDAEPVPVVADTMACALSNTAAIPLLHPEERYVGFYRKGYCELFGAAPGGSSEGFEAAARDFREALANWPKKAAPISPVGLQALTLIAELDQGRQADGYPNMAGDLSAVIGEPISPSPIMSAKFAGALVDTARMWLGWLAYRKNDFVEAARAFEVLTAEGKPPGAWTLWIRGRLAQQTNRIDEAVDLYEKALAAVDAEQKSANPEVTGLLGPKLEPASIDYQIALADYTRQRYDSAITHLDAAIKASPRNSYAIFLRARSKEALRLNLAAMEDYALAAQTGRASNAVWNVGQANYYRGLLLYIAKNYAGAEAEFSNALSARLGDIPIADVTAWKEMSAIAAHGCDASADSFEAAVNAASKQFPKEEASAMVFDCRRKQANTVDKLVALERVYGARIDPAKRKEIRAQIGAAYADQGVAAEDRKDSAAAIVAYRHAIEFNPANSKAHFNLGAIHIEQKRYDLAEIEFAALVQADASDYEAQYWLAESILAQRPPPDRVSAACALLRRSLAVGDARKKATFAKALSSAKCPN